MIAVAVRAIGLLAPGLAGWQASLATLRGEAPYQAASLPPPKPTMMAASERRRATMVTRLALTAAEEAVAGSGADPSRLASVFASSGGDMEIVDRICRALTQDDRPVSPTHFHNSVHNAAAGYWAIATGSMSASLSLSAHDGSFGAGLLEAATAVACEGQPVLLVTYDAPTPPPLAAKRPIPVAFAVALLCEPLAEQERLAQQERLARLGIEPPAFGSETRLADDGLEALRCANPAARSLPLLQAIARGSAASVTVPGGGGTAIRIEVNR